MITPLSRLRKEITKNPPAGGLDAILISSHANIAYLTNYCGFSKEEREAYLLVTCLAAKRAKNKQYILTDGRYSEAVKSLITDFELIEIFSGLSFEKALKNLAKKHKIKKLGFESHDITFLEHKKIKKYFNNIYHLSISNLRTIKEKEEISKIEKACALGDRTFDYILKKIKLGVSEKELAFEIEFFVKKNGADISFRPIVAFGKNSATPHHQTSDQRLKTKDKFVLLDFGVKLNNYCSDMTRTIFFGIPTSEQKRIYETVLGAQKKAIESLTSDGGPKRSRRNFSEVDRIARDYIVSKGYKTIPHSLGHGIGIDVHEAPHLSPKSKDILKQGMVFSIEPGIYIPNLGGVRIEDLVVLTKSGPCLLTHSPKTLIEL